MRTTDNTAKERIIEVATRLFATHGYDGVSVREIASEAGVNISAVSYYFDGKEKLYNEVLAEGLSKMRKVVEDIAAEQAPLRDRLEMMFEVIIEFLNAGEGVPQIILSEMALGGGRLPPAAIAHFASVGGIVSSVVSDAVKKGELRDTDDMMMFISFVSFPAYLVFAKPIISAFRGEKGYTKAFIKKAARHHVGVLLNGLSPNRGNKDETNV